MQDPVETVKTLDRRIRSRLFLARMVRHTGFWLMGFATSVLVLRYVALWSVSWWWANLALLPIAIEAWLTAARQSPSPDQLRAWLDRHTGQGGLLLATAECEPGDWSVGSLPQPVLRWRSLPLFSTLLAAAAYLVMVSSIPDQWFRSVRANPIDLSGEVARIEADLEVLEETELLDAREAGAYRESLAELARESDGRDPGETWEALDALERGLDRAAESGVADLERQDQILESLSGIQEALDKSSSLLGADELAAAMSDLSSLTKEKAEESELLREALAGVPLEGLDLETALRDPKKLKQAYELTEAQMARIAKALERLEIVRSRCKRVAGEIEMSVEELIEFLENTDKLALSSACNNMLPFGMPGGGGGASRLTWQDPSNTEAASFEEQPLDPDFSDPTSAVRVGVSTGEHEVGAPRAAGHGALEGAATGTGSAHTHPIRPRHRAAVARYFETDKGNR